MILVENSKKKDRILIPYGDNSEMLSNPIVHKHQHIYFYESVNQRTIQELVIALRSASLYCQNLQVELGLDKAPPVHLHIHSYGGDVYSGLAGASHILNNKVPVYTYVEGGVASAGTLLSLVGKKRYMQEYGYMLIHQVSGWCMGNFEQIKDEGKNLNSLMGMLYDFYEKHSGLKRSKIEKVLKRDIWFNSKKCLKHGLIDEIL